MRLLTLMLLQLLVFMPIVATAVEVDSRPAVQKEDRVALTGLQKAAFVKTYGRLPLYFIENRGQVDGAVRFYEKGAGHATFFTTDGVVISLTKTDDKAAAKPSLDVDAGTFDEAILGLMGPEKEKVKQTTEALSLSFVGANKAPRVVAEEKQRGRVNYFIGNDKTKWRRDIPTYGAVTYKDVYRNIDIKFYGNNRRLEHDVIVRPGGDVSKVRFAYDGIEGLKITETGDLEVRLEDGKIIEKKPVVFQEIDGRRVAVDGKYRILGDNTYGFDVASYDHGKDLIIDPVLVYSTYLGGNNFDIAHDIAIDSAGNAYVTGETWSPNFPPTNAIQGVYGGGISDGFVTKINSSGSAMIYSTFLGGSASDSGRSIAVDSSGNAYVTGLTRSSDFPLLNPMQGILGGNSDAFITKLNPSGSALVYSTYLGGNLDDYGFGIALDSSDNAYVTGETFSSNFPLLNSIPAATGGYIDAFVTKINSTGSAIVYSTFLGGTNEAAGKAIAVDNTGAAYVTGWTVSTDFPIRNPIQGSIAGAVESFVTKIDPVGSAIIYSTYLGGSGDDWSEAIALDHSGNAYVTGRTMSTNFPLVNPIQGANGGLFDAFVTKISASGSSILYSTYLGGTNQDLGVDIAADAAGNAYVAGYSYSTDFPTLNKVQATFGGPLNDAFITKINPSGTALVYSTYLGGNSFDIAEGIAVDASGSVYVAGQTGSTDFPLLNPIQSVFGGTGDLFISKIGPSNTPPIANAGPDRNMHLGTTITLDGTASYDPDGTPIVSYAWNIDSAPTGSAATLTGANSPTPVFTPDVTGTYQLSLVVSDGTDTSAASTVFVTVTANLPPLASATGTPTTGNAPLTVAFDASTSTDPEGGPLSFFWDFGDPGSLGSRAAITSHTYNNHGNYTAVVTVTDDFGNTAQASVAITVTSPNQPPTVAPTASAYNGPAPLDVQFTANAADPEGAALTYSWVFGDGASSTLANPAHTYASPGTYVASVTVSDGSLTATGTLNINVGSPLACNVTEVSTHEGKKGKVEGKVDMKANFTYAGLPAPSDLVEVVFDGITLISEPFAAFTEEVDKPGLYEFEDKDLHVKMDFNKGTMKVSRHKMLLNGVDDANGVDVVISLGNATCTDHLVVREHENKDHEKEISHKEKEKK